MVHPRTPFLPKGCVKNLRPSSCGRSALPNQMLTFTVFIPSIFYYYSYHIIITVLLLSNCACGRSALPNRMLTFTVFIPSIIHYYYYHIITTVLSLSNCACGSSAPPSQMLTFTIYSFKNSLLLPYYYYQIVLVAGPHCQFKCWHLLYLFRQ